MKTEPTQGEPIPQASAGAKKVWMKPVAATVEVRSAENNPGPGQDGNNCHS